MCIRDRVHAIMGPNGSGKSTLSNILSGKKGYEVSGEVLFEKKDLFELETEERAHKGIFLAFQYPLEIPGVNTNIFLKTSLNAIKKARGEKELDALEFLKLVKEKAKNLKFDEDKLSSEEHRQVQKFLWIFFLGQILDLPTLNSMLEEYEISSNTVSKHSAEIQSKISTKNILRLYERIFEHQLSEHILTLFEKL